MTYIPWIVGFKKASGKNYVMQVMAESGPQAVRIASAKLSDKLGEGEFYIIGEKEQCDVT